MANSPISQFNENEKISTTQAPQIPTVFDVLIPRGLPERRIYAYIDIISTPNPPGDISFTAEILMFQEGAVVGSIPVNFASWTSNKNKSLASLVNSGGTPVGDTLLLNLAVLANAGTREQALQPFRINADIDKLQFHLVGVNGAFSNVTGYHFYLACVSTSF